MSNRGLRKNLQRGRHISQVLFFTLLVVIVIGSVCSFSLAGLSVSEPLGVLQVIISGGAFSQPAILLTFTATALAFILAVLIFGRAWCAWACPIGTLSESADYVMTKRHFKAYVDRKPRGNQDSLVQKAVRSKGNKYAMLGGVIASSAFTKTPAWCTFCPIGTVCRGTVAGGFVAGVELLIVGAVLAVSAYEKRFFCKYLCPVAGLLTAISRLNFFVKPKVKHETCTDCGVCNFVCPEGIKVCEEKTFAECTKCFVCYSKCPFDAVAIGLVHK